MRIIIYGLNFWPEVTGIGKYTGEMAEWLAGRGHQVTVITTPPYYPNWRIQNSYSGRWYRREQWQGITIYRCPLWVPGKPNGLKRIIHLLSFMVSSLPVLLVKSVCWKSDIIWTVEPTFFTVPVSILGAMLSRSKAWLHVQDFEIDAAFGLGLVRGSLVLKWLIALERFFMKRFDVVSSISEAMVRRLTERGVKKAKTFLFSNWVDTNFISPMGRDGSLRREWNITDDRVVALYAGNIGKKQGLELLFPVAREFKIKHPKILFVIAGDGAAKSELIREAAERKLDNIIFKPLQPIERLPMLLAAGDIHLVLQKRGVADLAMPSKLTGIFAAGGAALVTADAGTELHRIVNQQGLGLVIAPESPAALAESIELLTKDNGLRKGFQKNARQYARTVLSREIILKGFEQKCMEINR